jgi:hypothetical protein
MRQRFFIDTATVVVMSKETGRSLSGRVMPKHLLVPVGSGLVGMLSLPQLSKETERSHIIRLHAYGFCRIN